MTDWNDFETDRALDWCRYFLDFPPHDPGTTFRGLARELTEKGTPPPVPGWSEMARTGESVGFTPDLYYLLRLSLAATSPEGFPNHPENHAFVSRTGQRQVPLNLVEWAEWVDLVAAGCTAMKATFVVLMGDIQHPHGMMQPRRM